MKEKYKKLIELEDFYRDLKKKYPLTKDIWDKLLNLIEERKSGILNECKK